MNPSSPDADDPVLSKDVLASLLGFGNGDLVVSTPARTPEQPRLSGKTKRCFGCGCLIVAGAALVSVVVAAKYDDWKSRFLTGDFVSARDLSDMRMDEIVSSEDPCMGGRVADMVMVDIKDRLEDGVSDGFIDPSWDPTSIQFDTPSGKLLIRRGDMMTGVGDSVEIENGNVKCNGHYRWDDDSCVFDGGFSDLITEQIWLTYDNERFSHTGEGCRDHFFSLNLTDVVVSDTYSGLNIWVKMTECLSSDGGSTFSVIDSRYEYYPYYFIPGDGHIRGIDYNDRNPDVADFENLSPQNLEWDLNDPVCGDVMANVASSFSSLIGYASRSYDVVDLEQVNQDRLGGECTAWTPDTAWLGKQVEWLDPEEIAELYGATVQSVVTLISERGQGTGFRYGSDGVFVTAGHVVLNDSDSCASGRDCSLAEEVMITRPSKIDENGDIVQIERAVGYPVYVNLEDDLGYILVPDGVMEGAQSLQANAGFRPRGVNPIDYYSGRVQMYPERGEAIVVIGSPNGVRWTTAMGYLDRYTSFSSSYTDEINAVMVLFPGGCVEPGSSGSPMMDADGNVLAVVSKGGFGEFGVVIDHVDEDLRMLETEQPFSERIAELPPAFSW